MDIVIDELVTKTSFCDSTEMIIVSMSSISLSCIELIEIEPELFPDEMIKAAKELRRNDESYKFYIPLSDKKHLDLIN